MNILDKSNKNDHSSSAIDENQNFDDKNNHNRFCLIYMFENVETRLETPGGDLTLYWGYFGESQRPNQNGYH